MNKDDKRLRLTECPVCHGHLKITTVKCEDCGLKSKSFFYSSPQSSHLTVVIF